MEPAKYLVRDENMGICVSLLRKCRLPRLGTRLGEFDLLSEETVLKSFKMTLPVWAPLWVPLNPPRVLATIKQ